MPTVPLPPGYSTLVRTAYCTEAEARQAGATGDTATIMEYIGRASESIDRYTGELFVPTVQTVIGRVGGDNSALLPFRLSIDPLDDLTVSTMEDVVLDPSTYRAESSANPGGVDAIRLGPTWVGHNLLIVGMEPYNRYNAPVSIKVTGTFGYVEPPLDVARACAILAALESAHSHTDDVGSTPAQAADPEGNVLPVVPPFVGANDDAPELAEGRILTTGSRRADQLLAPYRRLRMTAV